MESPDVAERARERVVFPWRLMLIGSLVFTVLLNLLLWLIR